jgi:Ion transport protein
VLNFNDLASSFVTLFACMVVSNWYIIVQVYVNVTGSKYSRWFFIFFYVCCVIVMLNIIVAFAIDMYQCVETLNNGNKSKSDDE